MADFFGKLVERALGTAPAVQPLIAPRFAATTSLPTLDAVVETSTPAVVEQRTQPGPARQNDDLTQPAPEPRAPPTLQHAPRSERWRQPAPPDAAPPRLVTNHAAPAGTRAGAAPEQPYHDAVLIHRSEDVVSESSAVVRAAAPPMQLATARAERSRAVRPQISMPERRAKEQPGKRHAEPDAPPPIQVSIGRIDVRATPAPTRPVPQQRPPAAPQLSLDDYLRGRKGGRS